MAQLQDIVLYDIPSKFPGKYKPWSPSTWATRFALNYKGLPYHTEWIEYPDIKSHCIDIGASPSEIEPSGEPYYSLPVIYDPNTSETITDSFQIALYLDRQYPEMPKLFPVPNTESLSYGFLTAMGKNFRAPLYPMILAGVCECLNERSAVYFRETREANYVPKTLEEVSYGKGKDSEEYKKLWNDLEKGLQRLGEIMDFSVPQEGKRGPYVMGDTLSYVDLAIAASFVWARRAWAAPNVLKAPPADGKEVDGDSSEEWQRVCALQSARWKKYTDLFEKYSTVV